MKIRTRFFWAILIWIAIFPLASEAKSKTYLYRSRANWVKLVKLSNRQMAGVTLKHPHENLSPEQMEAMLLSLNMNKGSMFKKGFETSEIFSVEEAKKYAPLIVDGLRRASSNQVVNVSLIHKRPLFIMRNDHLTMMNVYVTDDGVHLYFQKLFAKLHSDYEQASKMDKAISDAKSLRVGLESGPGQKLAYDRGEEIILDPSYDFANNVHRTVVAQEEYAPGKKSKARKAKKDRHAAQDDAAATPSDSASRLRQLEDLKKQGLVTDAEYRAKRKEILGGI